MAADGVTLSIKQEKARYPRKTQLLGHFCRICRCTQASRHLRTHPKYWCVFVRGNSIVMFETAEGAKRSATLLGILLVLGACASAPPANIGVAVGQPRADLGQAGYTFQAPKSYRLRASDVISVTVYREPELSLDSARVGVDGIVSLPLLGGQAFGGKTTGELEQELTQKFASVGLKQPQVSINIVDYASHLVTVEGAVREAGVYPFQPGARLSSAIALASGPSRVAELKQVAIFRTQPDGIYVAKFDYAEVSRGTMLDPVLQPGDRVVVGTSALSQFWQDTLRALPAIGVFASVRN